MKVLVTGGAGYIGSTICAALNKQGHTPIILDNLSVGKEAFVKDKIFYRADIADRSSLQKIVEAHPDITCAIHCAALIVVPESVSEPHKYYRENVSKSVDLFAGLSDFGIKNIVFSSSASIYDVVPGFMVTETSPLKPNSPYAHTKAMMEQILSDCCTAYGLRGISLRYFNPIGADPELRSGPHVKEATHILGTLLDTVAGRRPKFFITGDDYETRDGTGIRDYIHVWDLALAHVKAVENISKIHEKGSGHCIINLGTGKGVTVKEFLKAFETVAGKKVPTEVAPRRPGDNAGSFANADTALKLLGWKAERSIEEGIRDALAWMDVRKNLLGF